MPRNVTVTLADGSKHTYRNVPDSVTPDQIEQRAAKDYRGQRVTAISGGRKAPKAAPKDESALRALALGAKRSLDEMAMLANRIPGAQYIDRFGQMLGMPSTAESAATTNAMLARNTRTGYQTAGKILGDIALTAPLMAGAGGAVAGLGRGLGSRALQIGGEAMASGGIGAGRTAAQTAAMTRTARLGELAARAAGAGAAGAGGAALTGEDAWTGGVIGAGLPIVGSVVRRLGGGGVDLFRAGKVKAGQIIREALGKDLDAARAAFAELAPDDQRLARQVLVDADVDADVFMGLGNIARDEAPQAYRVVEEAQDAARRQALADIAGGATEEEIRAATRAGRQAVSNEMAPVREAMYRKAGFASKAVPVAERIAQRSEEGAAAINESGIVPRMRGLEERAAEQAAIMGDMPAIFPGMEGIQKTRGIAGAAGQRAERAMGAQVELKDRARDMYQFVDDLAARGMHPMIANDLIAPLQAKLADPTVAVDTMQANVIRGVISKLQKATDRNGMLDARALGIIRRSGIGDLVEMWSRKISSGAAPTSGTVERGQSAALGMRNMIDDTLRQGGAGPLVDEFLRRSEQGYAAVNRGKLAGEAFKRYKKNPESFLSLMTGEEPRTVGKIMGGGPENETIAGAFAADPQRLNVLRQTQQELERDARVANLAASGASKARDIMVKERPNMLMRGLTGMSLSLSPAARIAAQGAENAMSAFQAPGTRREIGNAFLSGRDALAAINRFPSSLMMSETVSRAPAMARGAAAQGMRAYTANKDIDPVQAVFDDGSFATASGRQFDAAGNLVYDPFAPAR